MTIPKDPMILLSFLNMKLRDEYPSLEELCKAEDINPSKKNSQNMVSIMMRCRSSSSKIHSIK